MRNANVNIYFFKQNKLYFFLRSKKNKKLTFISRMRFLKNFFHFLNGSICINVDVDDLIVKTGYFIHSLLCEFYQLNIGSVVDRLKVDLHNINLNCCTTTFTPRVGFVISILNFF